MGNMLGNKVAEQRLTYARATAAPFARDEHIMYRSEPCKLMSKLHGGKAMKIIKCSSKLSCAQKCTCCLLRITSPAPNARIKSLEIITGVTRPCESVQITVDNNPPIMAKADEYGQFSVKNPYTLDSGPHRIMARSCPGCCRACTCFYIDNISPPPAPTISTPECGATIADPMPWISGKGELGNSVKVCIDGQGCKTAIVDGDGEYHVNFGVQFPDGTYTITVTQIGPTGLESTPVTCAFTIDTSHFMAEPISAKMGRTFRTVDINVLMSGSTGTAVVYYLMLPPGSDAPNAAEIMSYQNNAALRNGTAATGQFTTTVNPTQTTYIWALTGLDKPNPPTGVTGVVDGYRYDVYIYIVSGGYNSGVLGFNDDAMGMPFDTGLGSDRYPFTIRQLTSDELQKYPDLLAGNALNRPGVDETARQLENIERLVTLYEETDGLYGIENSMERNYLMTSDMDLSNYAAAYGGAGWEPIGDSDGWINDRKLFEHLFSGVFDGGDKTISNLSITPKATDDYFVRYRGLFGGVKNGTIKNLTLSGVTIDAFTTTPGNAELGSFVSHSHNLTLSSLTLQNATLTADADDPITGDTHTINMGGFVGAIYEGADVSNITGQNIAITVPAAHALALGGFAGYTDIFTGFDSYKNISLNSVAISGYAMIGGLLGYVVYSSDHISDVDINHLTITAPGGLSGGLIGLNRIFDSGGDQLIENCTIQNISITAGDGNTPSGYVGGIVGAIERNTFPPSGEDAPSLIANDLFGGKGDVTPDPQAASIDITIRQCHVLSGQIISGHFTGGIAGFFAVGDTPQNHVITQCSSRIPVYGTGHSIGGLVGFSKQIKVLQSFATGMIRSYAGMGIGGLIGRSNSSSASDSYSLCSINGNGSSGGIIGLSMSESAITNCYQMGNVSADSGSGGGITGNIIDSSTQGSLTLGGTISGTNAHRIVGTGSGRLSLVNNYAVNTVTPKPPTPPAPSPSGYDGGTIWASDILQTMQNTGWDTTNIWDASTIDALGRPTLFANHE